MAAPDPTFDHVPALAWCVAAITGRSMASRSLRLKSREICCGRISPVDLSWSRTIAKPAEMPMMALSAMGSMSNVERPGTWGSAASGSSDSSRRADCVGTTTGSAAAAMGASMNRPVASTPVASEERSRFFIWGWSVVELAAEQRAIGGDL
jgi:hypothetical protein